MPLFSFFQYFGVLIFLILSALTIGQLCLQVLPKPNFIAQNYPISLRLSSGTLMSVLFWAAIKTKGQSIMMLLLIPLGFMLYHLIKSPSQSKLIEEEKKNFNISNIWPFILLLFVVFFLQLFFFTGFISNVLFPPDVCLYSEMAYYLNWGFENSYGNVNGLELPEFQRATPYHYGELWLANLIFHVFPSISRPGLLLFGAYPLLIFVFIASVFEHVKTVCIKNKPWLALFLTIGTLFLGGILTDGLHPVWSFLSRWTVVFETLSGWATQTGIYSHFGQKHLPVYIISFWSIVFWLNSRHFFSLMMMALIPILNIGVAPAIFGAYIASFIVLKLKPKWSEISISKTIYPFLLILFLLPVFYIYFGENHDQQSLVGRTPSSLLSLVLNTSNSSTLNLKGFIMAGIVRLIAAAFLFLVSFVPFIVFFGLFYDRIMKRIEHKNMFPIMFLFFLVLAAISTRMFFYGYDSAQLLTYTWPIFSVLILFLLFAFFVAKGISKPKKALVSLFFGLIICQNIIYITRNHQNLRKKLNVSTFKETFYDDKKEVDMNMAYIVNKASSTEIPVQFICYFRPLFSVLSDLNLNQLYFINATEQFTGAQRLNPPSVRNSLSLIPEYNHLSVEERQLKFIRKFKVNVLFLEKGTPLPFYINQTNFWMSDTSLNVDIYRIDERHH